MPLTLAGQAWPLAIQIFKVLDQGVPSADCTGIVQPILAELCVLLFPKTLNPEPLPPYC